MRKENDKLGKVAAEGSRKIKELGNVQNWAEMLERDFLVLGEFVRLVDGGSESGSSWTDSEGEEEGNGRGHATDQDHEAPGISRSDDAMTLDTTTETAGDLKGKGKGKLAPAGSNGDAEMQDHNT